VRFSMSGISLATAARRLTGTMATHPLLIPESRRLKIIAAVALLVIGSGVGTYLVVDRVASLPDGTALSIGDKMVTEEQFQQRVKLLETLYGVQPPTSPVKADRFRRDTAKAVALSELLVDLAQENGIVIADKAASDQLGTMVNEQYNGDRSMFRRQLSARGISERQVIDEIKRQKASARLFATITKRAKTATAADAREYYERHKNDMRSPERREIVNIVTSYRGQAEQVAQQARSGVNFGKLAQRYSIDGSTRSHGGRLGMVSADQLASGYAKVAFESSPYSVFGPVKTPHGWNIGTVVKVQKASLLPFSRVKDTLMAKLTNDAKMRLWSGWLTQRLREAEIEYAPRYQPSNPDAAPGAPSGR